MPWVAPTEKDTANETLEKRLWAAADQFRANSGLKQGNITRLLSGSSSGALPKDALLNGGRSYVIDRLIRGDSGIRWVVDFKTRRHEGADIEGFLDQEQKRYAAQLDAYSAALGGASRGLYFPLHAGWRKW